MESFDLSEICLKKKPLLKIKEEIIINESEKYILVLDLDETLIHADTKKVCADDHEIHVLEKLIRILRLWLTKNKKLIL